MKCSHCTHEILPNAKFCPECGHALGAKAARYTLRGLAGIAVLGAAFWGVSWTLAANQAGVKPTTHYTEPQNSNEPAAEDPEIKALTAAAEKDRDNIVAWQKLADHVITQLQNTEQTPSPALVFSAIEALSNILRLDPKEPRALIAMADIAFNQQVFDKASSYYERFLAVEPNDHPARARYASALSFMGKFDAAIAELNKVLAQEPDNFHALAYLSITLAQKGDLKKAKEVGAQALQKAPNEEARARFNEFLVKMDEEEKNPTAQAKAAEPSAAATEGTEPAIVSAIKNNPIAGPKFVRHETAGDTLTLFFRAFPMSQMPPFAKDKFMAGIRAAAAGSSTKRVLFKDADNGAELATLDL